MVQRLDFEELHDSVVGDVVDFQGLVVASPLKHTFISTCSGRLKVDTITSNVILIILLFDSTPIATCSIAIYKDTDTYLELTY